MKRLTKHIAIIILIFSVSCSTNIQKNHSIDIDKRDSIKYWIEQVEFNSFSTSENETILQKAHKLTTTIQNDSLKRNNLINISRVSNGKVSTSLFHRFNKEAFDASEKAKDTLGLAKTHFYYGYNYYNFLEAYDSAYYHFNKAKNHNIKLNRTEMVGWCLFEMAYILSDIKNYTGSEILIIEALKNFNQEKNIYGIISSHGFLATIFGSLQEYEKSLTYDFKVLKLMKGLTTDTSLTKEEIIEYQLIHQSNIGSTYFYMGKFEKALNFYKEAFKNNKLKDINPNLYYRLIHNINYTNFKLGDTLNVKNKLYSALKYRDSVGDIAGIIDSKLDLAQYLAFYKDTSLAIEYTQDAKSLAASIRKNDDHLNALKLLSKLDREKAENYLTEYISLNDSLQIKERKTRNKFARIQFETNEQIEKAEKLSQQNIQIISTATGIIIILLLLYYIKMQRSKNHRLQFEQQQQKSNEEIYNLMLQQQSLTEDGQLKERQRIAEELHDGIIGKIFGTRINLSFLNFNGTSKDELKYQNLILELQEIEKEVRLISHELKHEQPEAKQNFDVMIDSLLKNQSQIGKFEYKIQKMEDFNWNTLDGTFKTNIYRIIQESLLNCIKHANASKVELQFKKDKFNFVMIIKDNGKGFDANKSTTGIGLNNIRSRVDQMGGILSIESNPKTGTKIEVTVANLLKSKT